MFNNFLDEILEKEPAERNTRTSTSQKKQASTTDVTNNTIQHVTETMPTAITAKKSNLDKTDESNKERSVRTDTLTTTTENSSDSYPTSIAQPIHSESHMPLPTELDTATNITILNQPGKSAQNMYAMQSTSTATSEKNTNTATITESSIISENTADMESANPQFSTEAQHPQLSEPANSAANGKTLPPFTTSIATIMHATIPTVSHAGITVNNTTKITAPFHQPTWAEAFNQKITWLVSQGTQAAELKLHPAHLGPIKVSLQLSADQQLTAQFTSHHSAVRDAIEANLPRLREIMAESGITLADTSVGADNSQQQTGNEQNDARHARPSINYFTNNDTNTAPSNAATPIVQRSGLIDTFA